MHFHYTIIRACPNSRTTDPEAMKFTILKEVSPLPHHYYVLSLSAQYPKAEKKN